MKELILGMALGFLAFTEDGHRIGNKMADFVVKNGKPAVEQYVKPMLGGKLSEKKGREEMRHEDH